MEEKKAQALWKLTTILLCIALLGYGGIYLHNQAHPLRQTMVATSYTYRDSVSSTGILVRSESLLSDARPYSLVTAQSGKRVAAGEKLGVSYDNEADRERQRRINSLQKVIAKAEQVLGAYEQEKSSAERHEEIASAVLSLSACIAQHNTADIRYEAVRFRALVMDNGVLLTREELATLKNQLALLEESETGNSYELISSASGVFTPTLDGSESISPAVLDNLSVNTLRTLMAGHPRVDKRCYGKLITDYKWYYAALLKSSDCASLTKGSKLKLDLSAWRVQLCPVTVESVSAEVDGMCAVLFSSDTCLAETVELRTISCPLVFRSITGVRINRNALLGDQASGYYVLVDIGISERRENVEILHEEGDWVLVKGIEEGVSVILP